MTSVSSPSVSWDSWITVTIIIVVIDYLPESGG
jgi:hypothetical protein